MSLLGNFKAQVGLENGQLPLPGQPTKMSAIAKLFWNAHNEEYSEKTSISLTETLKRYILSRSRPVKRTVEFVKQSKENIQALQEYNLEVAKLDGKYPKSESFEDLLAQYLCLECDLFYSCPQVDPRKEREIALKLIKFLRFIYFDIYKDPKLSMRDLLQIANRKILHLLKLVPFHILEYEVVESLTTLILNDMEVLDEVNALKGRNVPFRKDTLLEHPLSGTVDDLRKCLSLGNVDDEGDDDVIPVDLMIPSDIFLKNLKQKNSKPSIPKHQKNKCNLDPKQNPILDEPQLNTAAKKLETPQTIEKRTDIIEIMDDDDKYNDFLYLHPIKQEKDQENPPQNPRPEQFDSEEFYNSATNTTNVIQSKDRDLFEKNSNQDSMRDESIVISESDDEETIIENSQYVIIRKEVLEIKMEVDEQRPLSIPHQEKDVILENLPIHKENLLDTVPENEDTASENKIPEKEDDITLPMIEEEAANHEISNTNKAVDEEMPKIEDQPISAPSKESEHNVAADDPNNPETEDITTSEACNSNVVVEDSEDTSGRPEEQLPQIEEEVVDRHIDNEDCASPATKSSSLDEENADNTIPEVVPVTVTEELILDYTPEEPVPEIVHNAESTIETVSIPEVSKINQTPSQEEEILEAENSQSSKDKSIEEESVEVSEEKPKDSTDIIKKALLDIGIGTVEPKTVEDQILKNPPEEPVPEIVHNAESTIETVSIPEVSKLNPTPSQEEEILEAENSQSSKDKSIEEESVEVLEEKPKDSTDIIKKALLDIGIGTVEPKTVEDQILKNPSEEIVTKDVQEIIEQVVEAVSIVNDQEITEQEVEEAMETDEATPDDDKNVDLLDMELDDSQSVDQVIAESKTVTDSLEIKENLQQIVEDPKIVEPLLKLIENQNIKENQIVDPPFESIDHNIKLLTTAAVLQKYLTVPSNPVEPKPKSKVRAVKPKVQNRDQQRITRNMAKTESNAKPHDFIDARSPKYSHITNDIYAEKTSVENNTTSEDSTDSTTLVIDEDEKITKSEERSMEPIYNEETITDFLEFIKTEGTSKEPQHLLDENQMKITDHSIQALLKNSLEEEISLDETPIKTAGAKKYFEDKPSDNQQLDSSSSSMSTDYSFDHTLDSSVTIGCEEVIIATDEDPEPKDAKSKEPIRSLENTIRKIHKRHEEEKTKQLMENTKDVAKVDEEISERFDKLLNRTKHNISMARNEETRKDKSHRHTKSKSLEKEQTPRKSKHRSHSLEFRKDRDKRNKRGDSQSSDEYRQRKTKEERKSERRSDSQEKKQQKKEVEKNKSEEYDKKHNKDTKATIEKDQKNLGRVKEDSRKPKTQVEENIQKMKQNEKQTVMETKKGKAKEQNLSKSTVEDQKEDKFERRSKKPVAKQPITEDHKIKEKEEHCGKEVDVQKEKDHSKDVQKRNRNEKTIETETRKSNTKEEDQKVTQKVKESETSKGKKPEVGKLETQIEVETIEEVQKMKHQDILKDPTTKSKAKEEYDTKDHKASQKKNKAEKHIGRGITKHEDPKAKGTEDEFLKQIEEEANTDFKETQEIPIDSTTKRRKAKEQKETQKEDKIEKQIESGTRKGKVLPTEQPIGGNQKSKVTKEEVGKLEQQIEVVAKRDSIEEIQTKPLIETTTKRRKSKEAIDAKQQQMEIGLSKEEALHKEPMVNDQKTKVEKLEKQMEAKSDFMEMTSTKKSKEQHETKVEKQIETETSTEKINEGQTRKEAVEMEEVRKEPQEEPKLQPNIEQTEEGTTIKTNIPKKRKYEEKRGTEMVDSSVSAELISPPLENLAQMKGTGEGKCHLGIPSAILYSSQNEISSSHSIKYFDPDASLIPLKGNKPLECNEYQKPSVYEEISPKMLQFNILPTNSTNDNRENSENEKENKGDPLLGYGSDNEDINLLPTELSINNSTNPFEDIASFSDPTLEDLGSSDFDLSNIPKNDLIPNPTLSRIDSNNQDLDNLTGYAVEQIFRLIKQKNTLENSNIMAPEDHVEKNVIVEQINQVPITSVEQLGGGLQTQESNTTINHLNLPEPNELKPSKSCDVPPPKPDPLVKPVEPKLDESHLKRQSSKPRLVTTKARLTVKQDLYRANEPLHTSTPKGTKTANLASTASGIDNVFDKLMSTPPKNRCFNEQCILKNTIPKELLTKMSKKEYEKAVVRVRCYCSKCSGWRKKILDEQNAWRERVSQSLGLPSSSPFDPQGN